MAERVRYRFAVTEEDIASAEVGDSYRCVIAQTIKRQIPDASHIEVDTQTIRWSDEGGRHVFLTPFAVGGYVVAFDAGEEIVPFRFQIEYAVPAAQKRAKTEAARAAKKSRRKITTERSRRQTAAAVLSDPDAPPDRVAAAEKRLEEAPERIAAAEEAHEDLKAVYKAAGESMAEERITETKRAAAPTVYKKKRREYGARVLRVNQAPGRKHYA